MTEDYRPKKANHKHQYSPCVFEYHSLKLDRVHGFVTGPIECSMGSYCDIRGKIGPCELDKWYRWSPSGHTSEPTEEATIQLNPETRTLPTFKLSDRFSQKFVNIDKDREGGV